MKSLISPKSLATVAFALGAFAAASAVQARSDVYFSVGVQVPGIYVQPAPDYVYPRQQIFVPAPSYYGGYDDGRRYLSQFRERRGPYGDRDGDGIANIHDRDSSRHQWRQTRLYGPYGDLDRDGIRSQDDRDRDRDGDGVRNRHDRVPSNPYRR